MKQPVIIRNDIIPFNGYAAINLFGILFVRNGVRVDDYLINHELIHTRQMKELLYIGFYIAYLLFWLSLLFTHKFNLHKAYMAIPFEKEAYANQYDLAYLRNRKPFSWTRYLPSNKNP